LNRRCLGVGQESLPLDHGTIPLRAEAARLELATGLTAPVFETGSSSGRMTSVLQVAGAGIEPTPERSERPVLPLDDPASMSKVRGAGLEPASPGSKPGSLPLADPRECPAGIEPALPGWKPGTSAARPRAQSCGGRNRTCVGAVNSRLPVPARVPPQ
jgi:hypothetical protein